MNEQNGKALAVAPQNGRREQSLALPAPGGVDVLTLADHFVKSGFFQDSRDVSKAVVKILYGQEHGIGPVSSMMNVHVIQGKPSMSATMIAAVINRSGRYSYRVKALDAKRCVIAFFEGTEHLGDSEFTMQDAATAGLMSNPTWGKYPKAMLFSRAMSAGARIFCPGVFTGSIYTPEEMGAETDEEGRPLTVDVAPVASPPEVAAERQHEATEDPDRAERADLRRKASDHLKALGVEATVQTELSRILLGGRKTASAPIEDLRQWHAEVLAFETADQVRRYVSNHLDAEMAKEG